MIKISTFINSKNEEHQIEEALRSLSQFADEIIVVDQSTDNTKQIAKKYATKIIDLEIGRSFSFAELRNISLKECRFDWVFYLDADETCSPELIQWIKKFKELEPTRLDKLPDIKPLELTETSSVHPMDLHPATARELKSQRVDMIEIRRREYFLGELHNFGSGNPSHQWRLFRREDVEFKGQVHEYPFFKGQILRSEKSILHKPKTNISIFVDKMNRYTTLDAEDMFTRGLVRPGRYMFFSGLAMFLKAYFRKQGFRDGWIGFFLAVSDGMTFFLKQAKLYFMNKKARRV